MKINKKILQKTIDKYGPAVQAIVAIEELAELQKEICKTWRKPIESCIDSLCDEIADVYIMLEQLQIIFMLDKNKQIQKRIDYKINRLKNRLEAADENKNM